MSVTFILASQSPRRRRLLDLLDAPVVVRVSGANEDAIEGQDAVSYVNTVARRKAEVIAALPSEITGERPIIIAADTTVELNGDILGKPETADEATAMLRRLRNRTHRVHTGLCVIDVTTGQEVVEAHTAVVTMRNYSDAEIDRYVVSGDPMDKAGAYAIQDDVFRPVIGLEGCYLGVMGLSLCHLVDVLQRMDVPLPVVLEPLEEAHDGFACPLLTQLRLNQS